MSAARATTPPGRPLERVLLAGAGTVALGACPASLVLSRPLALRPTI